MPEFCLACKRQCVLFHFLAELVDLVVVFLAENVVVKLNVHSLLLMLEQRKEK